MKYRYRIVKQGKLFYPEYFCKSLFISYWNRFKEDSFLYNGIFSSYEEVDVYFTSEDEAKDYIDTYKNKQIKKVVWKE